MAQKLQFLLEEIKNKEIVLPEFQREYTWSREQAKNLLDSLLKGYPTGSLLIWKTKAPPALKNLPEFESNGRVSVLLDGQQRLTALYLFMRNKIPPYYKTIPTSKDPRNLYYNLGTRKLKYYMKIEMENNPEWIRVIDCFENKVNLEEMIGQFDLEGGNEEKFRLFTKLNSNLNALQDLVNYEYSVMRVKENSGLKDALTVFDRVNTGGTPLSEADVALAYMCSNWEEIRREFKKEIDILKEQGFEFDLRFMIRSLNAVINGRAYYNLMHDVPEDQLKEGWEKLKKILAYVMNFLKDRAYIYSTKDLNTPNVLIPLIGYLSNNDLKFKKEKNLKRMLYWFYAALYKRRYSASVDQYLEKDLQALGSEHPIEDLIGILREEEGGLEINYADLQGRWIGHPLYNMMCFVIRKNGGVDWANNLDLSNPIGRSYQVQRHHIFPKAMLRRAGYDTADNKEHYNMVHEIANRVPLTQRGNMETFDKEPSDYLPEVEKNNPGNMHKFFIPMNGESWKVENFEDFLEKRRKLIVEAINNFMEELIGRKT